MNTFEQLNSYSQNGVPANSSQSYSITWTGTAANQSIAAVEDTLITVPTPVNLTAMAANPANITYSVNTSPLTNVICSWASESFPPWITYTDTGALKQITGQIGPISWSQFSAPTLLAKDYANNWSFVSNIVYADPSAPASNITISYTSNVTVTSQGEISQPGNVTFNEDATTFAINPSAQITDAYSGNLPYTCTLTPNITNAVFRMNSVTSTGGTSTFNSSTKVLTLNGTKTEVNAHLANVYLDITHDWANNFVMSYNLTNPISNLQTAVSQNFNVGNTASEFTWNLITNTVYGVQYPSLEYTTLVANPIGLQIQDNVANANYTVQFARADSTVSNYDNSVWFVNGVASGTGRANLTYGPVSKATLNSANIALLVTEPTSTVVVGGKTQLNPPVFQYYFNLYRNDPIQGNVNIAGNAAVGTGLLTVANFYRAAEISFTEVSSRNYQQAFKMFAAGNLVIGNTAGNALYRMTVTQTSPGNTGITTATVRGNIAGSGLAPLGGGFFLPSGQANVLGYFQNPANVTLPGNAAFRDSNVASGINGWANSLDFWPAAGQTGNIVFSVQVDKIINNDTGNIVTLSTGTYGNETVNLASTRTVQTANVPSPIVATSSTLSRARIGASPFTNDVVLGSGFSISDGYTTYASSTFSPTYMVQVSPQSGNIIARVRGSGVANTQPSVSAGNGGSLWYISRISTVPEIIGWDSSDPYDDGFPIDGAGGQAGNNSANYGTTPDNCVDNVLNPGGTPVPGRLSFSSSTGVYPSTGVIQFSVYRITPHVNIQETATANTGNALASRQLIGTSNITLTIT
jgi:hypothetical protein